MRRGEEGGGKGQGGKGARRQRRRRRASGPRRGSRRPRGRDVCALRTLAELVHVAEVPGDRIVQATRVYGHAVVLLADLVKLWVQRGVVYEGDGRQAVVDRLQVEAARDEVANHRGGGVVERRERLLLVRVLLPKRRVDLARLLPEEGNRRQSRRSFEGVGERDLARLLPEEGNRRQIQVGVRRQIQVGVRSESGRVIGRGER